MEALTFSRGNDSDEAVFSTRVIARRFLSAGAFELSLAKPPGFTFVPGQRVRLRYADLERDYSIASAPAEDAIQLCIRRMEKGQLSVRLAAAAVGTPLICNGPRGYFTFKPSSRPAVWVATGTGIAPFRAMAAAGISGFTLLHGVSGADDLFYRDFFWEKGSDYTACLSNDPAAAIEHFDGRVTEYMQRRLPTGTYDFYLCGRQDMVRDAIRLVDERFPGSLVFTEVFY
jgi:NAD(P)H-flavin reductase